MSAPAEYQCARCPQKFFQYSDSKDNVLCGDCRFVVYANPADYEHWTGRPHPKQVKDGDPCSVDGCETKYYARGYCYTHWRKHYRNAQVAA